MFAIIEARDECLLNEHNARINLAYHVAIFRRWPANKRLPPLKRYLARGRRRLATPEEQEEYVRMLNAALGGTVKKRT